MKAVCSPLCGAAKAYGRFAKWWQHEPQCPVRLQYEADKKDDREERSRHPVSDDTDRLARDRAELIHALTADELDVETFRQVAARWDVLVEIAKVARAVSDEYERSGEITDSATEDGDMMEALAAALVALEGKT